MSIMHFLAANKEMPLGSFGEKSIKNATKDKKAIQFKNVELPEGYIPLEQVIDLSDIKEEEIEVYSTYEDAAGIYVEKVPTENENVKKHFRNQFVYLVSANIGKFIVNDEIKKANEQMYLANKKCVSELFEYIRNNKGENEEFELYSCWFGEEEQERDINLDTVIELKEFQIGDNFYLKEQQYITVK